MMHICTTTTTYCSPLSTSTTNDKGSRGYKEVIINERDQVFHSIWTIMFWYLCCNPVHHRVAILTNFCPISRNVRAEAIRLKLTLLYKLNNELKQTVTLQLLVIDNVCGSIPCVASCLARLWPCTDVSYQWMDGGFRNVSNFWSLGNWLEYSAIHKGFPLRNESSIAALPGLISN